jgi:hypothetical protein
MSISSLLETVDLTELGPQYRNLTPRQIHERFTELRIFGRSYWDAQKHRIKLSNREFSGNADSQVIAEVMASVKHTEDLLGKAMVANLKEVAPEIYQWTRDTIGLGPVLMARLLGEVGHPCWAFPSHWEIGADGKRIGEVPVSDPPYRRSVSQLWSYCGHGDPTRKPRIKGITEVELAACGNPKAKMLAHLLAESCMKLPGGQDKRGYTLPRSPYRDTYDASRLRYADRDWTDGHKHNAALRATGKEILLDLWKLAVTTL